MSPSRQHDGGCLVAAAVRAAALAKVPRRTLAAVAGASITAACRGAEAAWPSAEPAGAARAALAAAAGSDAALAALGWDHGPLGTIGFCLGARYVHKAMQELPERFPAGAMWHPSFLTDDTDASPHLTVGEIGELWVGIGTADQVQSIEMHQRYFDAAAGFDNITVRIFDGADHGYTWPISPSYHEEAATVGWAATTDLFERVLA